MGLLDALKARIGDFDLGIVGKKSGAKPKTARDTMLEAIDHSIGYHKNAKYVLSKGKRKGKAPDLIYKIDGDVADISLRYSRVAIVVEGKNNKLVVPTKKLGDALDEVRQAVAAGEFDAQLNKIKAARSAAAKGSRSKKAT